jgi:hypothetical protein
VLDNKKDFALSTIKLHKIWYKQIRMGNAVLEQQMSFAGM